MRIGDRVEARYGEKDRWHTGKITSINPDGTIDIKYDSDMWNGWAALMEYGVKPGIFKVEKPSAMGNEKPLAPPSVAPPAPPIDMPGGGPKFHIGQRVEAKPDGKSKWFSATVMHVNNGGESFKIKYDSGMWNSWVDVNDPKCDPQNIRCYAGERETPSFDHSPIRKASDESAPTPAQKINSSASRGRKGSVVATTTAQPERMTRAQAAKAEKEAAALAVVEAAPPSTAKKTYPTYRETNAMRAKREAALKRRETLESDELKKYGETFESKKEQKAAIQEDAKKHSFLKRGDSKTITTTNNTYTSRVGASSQKAVTSDDVLSSNISSTPGGNNQNKRLSASNQYRSNQANQQEQEMQQQKELKQQKQKEQMKKQLQKQNSMQDKSIHGGGGNNRALSPGNSSVSNRRSQTVDDTSSNLVKKNNNNQANAPVVVVVRKRPAGEGETDVIRCLPPIVICNENKVKVDLTKYVHTHKFCYDASFGEQHTTLDLYDQSISSLIDNFMGGGSSTCFCFGQTASGKTFTLFGAGGGQVIEDGEKDMDPEAGGVYMLAAQDVFDKLESSPDLILSVSMFEIYGQKVRDLLDNGKELAALEDGKGVLQLVGLTGEECDNMSDFIHVSNVGRLARSTTATGANATSSRSHAAMLLRLVRRGPIKDGKPKASFGKFSLIDLAGSERGADNENTDKTTQMEGRQINQSLLALKEVIRAKELGRSHAPFRQSRLTQVLEESLTGRKCQTVVIGCISPNEKDIQQTVNTLRYAEGLRPGLKKDMAKKEKAAIAKEEARLLAIIQAEEEEEETYLVSQDMIAEKERELARMKREQENKMMLKRNDESDMLDDENDFEDQLDGDIYRESINPVALDLMNEDADDYDEDDLRADPSVDLDEDISYRRASALSSDAGQYQEEEEEEEFEECQSPEEDGGDEEGYQAYNGAGDVADMLREQDKAEVEALLAKQDRSLHESGKYQTSNSSSSSRRQASASSKKTNVTAASTKAAADYAALSLATANQSPQKSYSSAKYQSQAESVARFEAENMEINNMKQSNVKKLPPPSKVTTMVVAKTPANNQKQSKINNKNSLVTSTPGTQRKSSLLRQSLDDLGNSLDLAQSSEAEVSALQWRLKERDAEIAEKDKLIQSLTNRVSDLNRAVEESDTIRAQQASALKRERDRIEAVERTYHEAMMKLEADINEVLLEKDGLLAELDDKDTEVHQLVAEVEDREARNNELKLMLKKLLETQTPVAPNSVSKARNSTGGGASAQRNTRSATKNKAK